MWGVQASGSGQGNQDRDKKSPSPGTGSAEMGGGRGWGVSRLGQRGETRLARNLSSMFRMVTRFAKEMLSSAVPMPIQAR